MSDESDRNLGQPDKFGLTVKPESESIPDEAGKAVIPHVTLDEFIGGRSFITIETQLVNSEKDFGVTRDTDGRSNEFLLFDKDALNAQEKKLIGSFLGLIKDKGKEGLKGSPFEWYFEEESDEFVKDLARQLEKRLASLEEGLSAASFASISLKKDDNLLKAAQSFREMSKRAQIKETLKKHFDKLPIKGFIGLTKDGQEVEIDPADIDYIYIEGKSGTAEMIITCSNTKDYQQIAPVYYATSEEEKADRKFRRIPGTGEEKKIAADKSSGRDLTNYEFQIAQGAAGIDPLFTKVRVLSAPIDLNDEIRKLVEKEDTIRKKKTPAQSPTPKSQTYVGTPPSVPSSPPRYQQPATWISTSG